MLTKIHMAQEDWPTTIFQKHTQLYLLALTFLGDWQGGGFDAAYAQGRIPKNGKMSRHIQFEANMTLTGANADKRVAINTVSTKNST